MNPQTALVNVRQMGEADRLTVASGRTVVELMENAGSAAAREIEKRWSARPVIVLCGPGNNGGDGFVAARHLSATGWPVRVALLGSPDHLTGAARHHAELWCGDVQPMAPDIHSTRPTRHSLISAPGVLKARRFSCPECDRHSFFGLRSGFTP
jgi:NAD(P)H-hydrate epimerase